MANSYDIPSWAGKPPTGLHLDVLKDDKLVQKFMVDEKRCYLFGRNNQMNDFCIDHASCSRVHAAFVYHKHLDLAYLVDLGSTHGTFIGTLRLESHKPTHLQVNSMFHFGASTRRYILRERPSKGQCSNIIEDLPMSESCHGTMLGLPESQTELDNLTEYNTAHNRRISMLGITDDNLRKPTTCKHGTRKRRNVTFNEEEIIINPEDVDPNVGRFRNLIQTTIVPAKRIRFEFNQMGISNTPSVKISSNQHQQFYQHTPGLDMKASDTTSLYQGLPAAHDVHNIGTKSNASNNEFDVTPIAMGTKLGLLVPNPAPEITPDLSQSTTLTSSSISQKLAFVNSNMSSTEERHVPGENAHPQKKKYAKEAWPGRKPMLGQL